ncbi:MULTISPECIES: hypothetical protein [Paenibacillus]|uniref:hypothetical protein n=1 Tax=Paenibacillus TaxID=44249 RepID=UPI00040185BB|nr:MULTISPECIES: hypothetical protein [Paenibacillus]
MWLWIGVAGAWLLTGLLDLPDLWKKGKKKEAAGVAAVLAAATAGSLACILMPVPPNPLAGIAAVISGYSKAFYSLFT